MIDDFIKEATSEALIDYIATFRAFKLNKENAIKCMIELDNRRQNGDDLPYEELIASQTNIFKSVGKGFVVKIIPSFDIENVLNDIKNLNIDAVIFNKDQGLIHIGSSSQEDQTRIIALDGVLDIEPDQKAFKNVTSTGIFKIRKDS